jgi:2-aminoethylphosphonate-pyruvate transaminase
MAIADSAETATRWASSRAIDLWVCFGATFPLQQARDEGAIVVYYEGEPASAFRVFEQMRLASVADVRRVGVIGTTSEQLAAGRCAGVAAVVGIADDDALRAELLAAEPDAIVGSGQLERFESDRYGRGRLLRESVLLNPGPALTTDGVKRAAAGVDLCHREPEFIVLENRIRMRLRQVAEIGDEWHVALISGSGTAADELALAASVRPGRKLLLLENGVYGQRLEQMAARRGIPTEVVRAVWTEPVDVDDVEHALRAEPLIDAIALVHHETTSGLLNPLDRIAALARDVDVRLMVDAVSSFGAEKIELADSGIDFLACSSNKCLHGLPGAAFVLVSPEGAARAAEVPPSSVYLDLPAYIRSAEVGSVPFTPAIPALAALDAALAELIVEGGIAARRESYAARCAVLDAAFERLGLEQLIRPEDRSLCVRSVRLPAGISFERLHDRLKQDGYVIYAGQGPLAREIFRVCSLGALQPAALEGFADRLELALVADPAAA